MPGNFYLGGGGTNPYSGFGGGVPWNFGKPDIKIGANSDGLPEGPVGNTPLIPANQPKKNVLGAQAVRATGDAKGYDPSYLQNLATAIGGLFSRPQGNLSFNPLGDLSSISPPSGMEGNAPLPGLPSTWLQDALNGLGFSFMPKPVSAPNPNRGGGGDGGNGHGRRRGPNTL